MPEWVRVRDESTRHEYDVEASTLPRAGLTVIEGYPENKGPGAKARPAKPHVGKDGQPASTKQAQGNEPQDNNTPADLPADKANRSAR